jgi:hypothetical protein
MLAHAWRAHFVTGAPDRRADRARLRRYNRSMSAPSAAAPVEFVIVGLTQHGKRFARATGT